MWKIHLQTGQIPKPRFKVAGGSCGAGGRGPDERTGRDSGRSAACRPQQCTPPRANQQARLSGLSFHLLMDRPQHRRAKQLPRGCFVSGASPHVQARAAAAGRSALRRRGANLRLQFGLLLLASTRQGFFFFSRLIKLSHQNQTLSSHLSLGRLTASCLDACARASLPQKSPERGTQGLSMATRDPSRVAAAECPETVPRKPPARPTKGVKGPGSEWTGPVWAHVLGHEQGRRGR